MFGFFSIAKNQNELTFRSKRLAMPEFPEDYFMEGLKDFKVGPP